MANVSEEVAGAGEWLPSWFVVEGYRPTGAYYWRLRAGIRCRDGDLKVLDIPVEQLVSPGRADRITLTKRQVLESLQKHAAVELAKLSLEEY